MSSCTSRVGVAVRSIASEESVVAPAAQVSFGWKHEYPAETFGHTANRTTKEDSSVDVEKSVGLAKRGAIGIVLSNTVIRRSDHPGIGQMTDCSFEESVTKAKPEKIAVIGVFRSELAVSGHPLTLTRQKVTLFFTSPADTSEGGLSICPYPPYSSSSS